MIFGSFLVERRNELPKTGVGYLLADLAISLQLVNPSNVVKMVNQKWDG